MFRVCFWDLRLVYCLEFVFRVSLGLELELVCCFIFLVKLDISNRICIKVTILNHIFVKIMLFFKYFFSTCYFVNILVNCANFKKNPQKFFKGKLNLVGSPHQGNILCVCVCERERERERETWWPWWAAKLPFINM